MSSAFGASRLTSCPKTNFSESIGYWPLGEPVAIVVATTPAAAHEGAAAVAVAWVVRPLVVDVVAALAEGAPDLHAGVTRNRCYDWECGDTAAVGAPGAVINAILDALAPPGVTHIDMPATPGLAPVS